MSKNKPTTIVWYRRYLVSIFAAALILVTYSYSRYDSPSPEERNELAARFKFEKLKLPAHAPPESFKFVRPVHPNLKRIASWISSLGSAVSLADMDNDGLSNDVCAADPRTDIVSIFPAPGTPQRYAPIILDAAPLPFDKPTTAAMGTLVGDFNEDGGADLLVYYWGRTPVLFLREPGADALSRDSYTATELTDSGERWFTNAATQGDLDGDGHLDLVIGNYFKDGARILDANAPTSDRQYMHEGKAAALNGGEIHVFLWKPGGFEEVADVFPDHILYAWTLAAGAADLDGDQLPELYFSNDFGPDWLLHNRSTPGKLMFEPLTGHRDFTKPKSCVLGHDSFKGMGCDFADVNGDGLLDIYVSNIATRFGLTESHFVWTSTGDLDAMKRGKAPYVQESESLGLSRSGWGWDCRFADFDNDGVLEAVQACGFVKGDTNRWPELQSLGTSNDGIVSNPKLWPTFKPGADLSGQDWNPFFVRAADGRYYDMAPKLGIDQPMVSKGIAVADVNGDGLLDFAVANQWEDSYLLMNRSGSGAKSVVLSLLLPAGDETAHGSQSFGSFDELKDQPTRPAIGAGVRLKLADGTMKVGLVDGGTGHSGQRSPDVHFGLGDNASAELTVNWRDNMGQVHEWRETIEPGRHWILLGAEETAVTSTR